MTFRGGEKTQSISPAIVTADLQKLYQAQLYAITYLNLLTGHWQICHLYYKSYRL